MINGLDIYHSKNVGRELKPVGNKQKANGLKPISKKTASGLKPISNKGGSCKKVIGSGLRILQ